MTKKRTREQISYNMSRISSKGSKIERIMGKALWASGLRYRKHYSIDGKPDFAFLSAKVAVFCDSSFWHGKNWGPKRKKEFKANKDFWINKIERNIERDKEVNESLRKQGWKVMRFWDDEIKKHPDTCARKVSAEVTKRKGQALE